MSDDIQNRSAEPWEIFERPRWWNKPLIWGSFLVLLYLLREFFLIGFLTFLICFVVRGLIGILNRRILRDRESHTLDLISTLSIFAIIALTLYGIGRFAAPILMRQGKSLVAQLQDTTPEEIQNSLLANTVGGWKFQRQFGNPKDSRYQQALQDFQKNGRSGEGLFQTFPQLHSRLQAEFESSYEQAQVQHLQSQKPAVSLGTGEFDRWLKHFIAPILFGERKDYYITRWQAEWISADKSSEWESLKQRSDFESVRDEQIHQRILADLKSDPVMLTEYENQWADVQSIKLWKDFRKSDAYQQAFRSFYDVQRNENPEAVPIEYGFFQQLSAAYPKGKQDFVEVVNDHYQSGQESLEHQQHDFEIATKRQLGQQWMATSHVADWIRDHIQSDGPAALESFVAWVEHGVGELVRVPIQIATALVLSIFILIEWNGLKQGTANIRNTRLQPIYDEIVPGVIALGKLMGKSFQGQMVIALFNAVFTLIALWIIGVDYKFILSLTVFLFSFVPVIGVILSGVPICAVAILQPGGSIFLALQVLVAIAIIHLIEGMVLSPRIVGKIGHLHPVLVIGILLVAEHFFGMWGLILGVPVAIYIIRVVVLNSPIPGVYDPDSATIETEQVS